VTALGLQSSVVACQDQLSTNLADESVILNLANSTYYGVDGVAMRVWELLQQPRQVSDILTVLEAEYEVQREVLERDVVSFLERLAELRLVTVDGA